MFEKDLRQMPHKANPVKLLIAALLAFTPVRLVNADTPVRSPFDLTQKPGEHPLEPVIRVLTEVRDHIDKNVADYSCTLVKRERLDGQLAEHQHLYLKVRHEPFSVYVKFLQPNQGREVLYVAGQNENKLIALEGGWKRRFMQPVSLDPAGMIAMRGQKYPITRIGIRNLVDEYLAIASRDTKYAECNLTSDPNATIEGRSCTLIQASHPVPRKEFRGHVARVFLDNELRVPIYYDSYGWPAREGADPPIEESYYYSNLKINNGFGARDFEKDNPEIFQ
jgi:hypothetical protein